MKNSLISMAGPTDFDVSKLSNFEAGIAALMVAAQVYPGLTWGDVARLTAGEKMGGWWTDLKHVAGDVKDGVGDVFKGVGDWVGDKGGEVVRLGTDEKVIDGASRLGTAYATGGGSEGARGFLEQLGLSSDSSGSIMDFISGLGDSFKGGSGDGVNKSSILGMDAKVFPWAVAGVAVLVLVFGKRA